LMSVAVSVVGVCSAGVYISIYIYIYFFLGHNSTPGQQEYLQLITE
jgi:hypothetical protein